MKNTLVIIGWIFLMTNFNPQKARACSLPMWSFEQIVPAQTENVLPPEAVIVLSSYIGVEEFKNQLQIQLTDSAGNSVAGEYESAGSYLLFRPAQLLTVGENYRVDHIYPVDFAEADFVTQSTFTVEDLALENAEVEAIDLRSITLRPWNEPLPMGAPYMCGDYSRVRIEFEIKATGRFGELTLTYDDRVETTMIDYRDQEFPITVVAGSDGMVGKTVGVEFTSYNIAGKPSETTTLIEGIAVPDAPGTNMPYEDDSGTVGIISCGLIKKPQAEVYAASTSDGIVLLFWLLPLFSTVFIRRR